MILQSQGKLIYDPTAGKAKNSWWIIVECDKDILNYYHYWIHKSKGIKVHKPLFGSHISYFVAKNQPKVIKVYGENTTKQ